MSYSLMRPDALAAMVELIPAERSGCRDVEGDKCYVLCAMCYVLCAMFYIERVSVMFYVLC